MLLSYSLACYATDRCVLMASAVLPHVGRCGNTAYTYYIIIRMGSDVCSFDDYWNGKTVSCQVLMTSVDFMSMQPNSL